MGVLPDFNFFEKLAHAARDTSIPYFRHVLSIDNKEEDGFDPVTIADRETELVLREIIHQERPDDSIYGEEFPVYDGNNEFVWVIDPIDGTRSFISGVPIWGCLVGLKKNDKAVAGMMAQPFTREIYYSCGNGAYLFTEFDGENRQLMTSQCQSLADATLFSTDPGLFKGTSLNRFCNLRDRVKLTRYGADCYAFAMLASGFVDLVVETGLKPYDITALIPIIEQAGGVITQWNGNKAEDAGNIIAAATPELHLAALEILKT